jgi:uncharacterized membrane protein YkoI
MMHRTKIFPALFSAFFAIAVVAMTSLVMTSLGMSAPAMTALLGAQPGPHGSVVAPETSNEQSKTSLQAFDQAKISLQNAISTIESTLGGVVIDAKFQISNGHPVYIVTTSLAWDKSVCEGTVDAQTGDLIAKGKVIPDARLDQKSRSVLAGLHEWYASLGEAIVAAQDSSGGKPISAHLTEREGRAFFEVTLVKGASTIEVVVDANDGHVVS